jgi:adenylate cyclase
MIAFREPQHHHSLVMQCGSDAGLSALAYDACCLWCLGYPDQALARSQDALIQARELGHPFTLAEVIYFGGCMLAEMRRDAGALKATSEELVRLANEKGMQGWLAVGIWHQGEAAARLGQVHEGIARMREGMGVFQSRGYRVYLTRELCYLAEAQWNAGQPEEGLNTLAKALAMVEESDERHWEAELHRVRAELLLVLDEDVAAEASYQKAIEASRRQEAKSWELRASTGLARLWREQGRIEDAREMLGEIYGWFTEGFDTPDLMEARALLEVLSS